MPVRSGIVECLAPTLTGKQRRVLARLLDGDTHKEIAARLGISENTVNSHLKRVYAKFSVNTQMQLILKLEELARSLDRGQRTDSDGAK